MPLRTFLVLALTLVLLVPFASAEECERELVLGAPDGTYYSVDNDVCQPGCLFSVWVYSDDDPEPCDDEAETILL